MTLGKEKDEQEKLEDRLEQLEEREEKLEDRLDSLQAQVRSTRERFISLKFYVLFAVLLVIALALVALLAG